MNNFNFTLQGVLDQLSKLTPAELNLVKTSINDRLEQHMRDIGVNGDLTTEEWELLRENKLINCVKLVRERLGIGLRDAKVAAWIDTYHERQRDLREHARGRPRSVGLTFLVDQTLECRPSEVARRLVEARVLPERESEHDDLQAQWLQLLKRARTRFRRRNGL